MENALQTRDLAESFRLLSTDFEITQYEDQTPSKEVISTTLCNIKLAKY